MRFDWYSMILVRWLHFFLISIFFPSHSIRQRDKNRCEFRRNSWCLGAITHAALLGLIKNETFGWNKTNRNRHWRNTKNYIKSTFRRTCIGCGPHNILCRRKKLRNAKLDQEENFSLRMFFIFFHVRLFTSRVQTRTHSDRVPQHRVRVRLCGLLSASNHKLALYRADHRRRRRRHSNTFRTAFLWSSRALSPGYVCRYISFRVFACVPHLYQFWRRQRWWGRSCSRPPIYWNFACDGLFLVSLSGAVCFGTHAAHVSRPQSQIHQKRITTTRLNVWWGRSFRSSEKGETKTAQKIHEIKVSFAKVFSFILSSLRLFTMVST